MQEQSLDMVSVMRELIFQATKKDFRIDWFSGTGPGGQYRNKHQNCCRILHIPTGLMAVGQRERNREQNFKDAFGRLAAKVVAQVLGDQRKLRGDVSEVIRTYHEPDNRVKDAASGLVRTYKETVGKADMSEMIMARAKAKIDAMVE